MSDKPRESEDAPEKPSVTLPGKVEKIIPGVVSTMPDKAQIAIEGAEHLYKEIRVENTLQDEDGKPVCLKPGAEVEVTRPCTEAGPFLVPGQPCIDRVIVRNGWARS